MGKTVMEINLQKPDQIKRLKVAAYARVSCAKDTMLHSLAAQIDYYRNMIRRNLQWEFAGVYADEAKTGTKEDRPQFQELLKNCRAGGVDMIITKSVSRFARNTVTLLKTVRELKDLGIDVYFEEQNIHTVSADGELLLTLLASFAQAESLSVSENCKWRIRRQFQEGKPTPFRMLGYRLVEGQISAVPEEAETVRRIFELYLQGFGTLKIANILNEEGITTVNGSLWAPFTVTKILNNEKYCGDLLLQKSFVADHLKKASVPNTGQLPQYLIEDNHDPIIDRTVFQAAKAEQSRRAVTRNPSGEKNALAGMIRCDCCGKNYRRKTAARCDKWCCSTFNTRGKRYCPDSKMIPEETLVAAICEMLEMNRFDEDLFLKRVERIDACKGNMLRFVFKNGMTEEYVWKDRSRAESWTPEMRESARQAAIGRRDYGR